MARHKYKAKRVEDDGHKFPSKLEHKHYTDLKQLQQDGDIVFFLRQVPFHLPGGIKYVVDFQVFWKDGTVTFIDSKGMETQQFKRSKKMVEALYPVEIEVWK